MYSETSLSAACKSYNILEVQRILDTRSDDTHLTQELKSLIRPCAHGGQDNVKLFSVLAQCYNKLSPNHSLTSAGVIDSKFIYTAIKAPDCAIWDAMLASGWDPETPLSATGDTLCAAIMQNKLPVVDWLLTHGAGIDANGSAQSFASMAHAARFASSAVIQCLLDAGAQIRGTRAMHMAAYDGRVDNMRFLLERGADINEVLPDENDWVMYDRHAKMRGHGTPLHAAIENGAVEAVEFLLENGASMSVMDSKGRTPLELSEVLGSSDNIKKLLQKA